ncbi:AAA family ATPase [Paenarthrobacter sp. DKR-5]|uniref:AAA family ATPase n=1 Tax=Paenarthrobacter sp. DKR-5 TaxID=2835535 RepID=UPI001BDD3D0D|nr:AAA family ATPase [Paenarthrobacter sp. DKR-5]MBT1001047.1 AAA family ATPase [Paenarthrobacter sp. DKR-5]
MSRFILITSTAVFEHRLRTVISEKMGGTLDVLPVELVAHGAAGILNHLTAELPEVVLLGPGVATDDAVNLASAFELQYPGTSLVLVAESDVDVALKAMRAGIRELVSPEADAKAIHEVLLRACEAAAVRRSTLSSAAAAASAPSHRGRVVAVSSPKGGVGKTTVATNLAVGLAQYAPGGVVVVDLDVQFGDVATALLLEPQHTLTDAVQASAASNSMVLKTYLTVHPAGIYALCAPSNPADADHITGEQVGRVIEQLAAEFAYVVIDTAPGINEHLLGVLEAASDVVWVCGMDIPSVRGLRSELALLDEAGLLPPSRHVVLNFVDRRSGLTVQDVEASAGVPVDVSIPRSRVVPYSTNKGVPLLQDKARDGALKSLKKLVERFDPAWADKPRKQVHRRAVLS